MNWEHFLRSNNIEYVEHGPNVKRGNINIACPLCGDDPSHHLGINLETNQWGCWRNATHVGRKPEGLVRALLNCSYHQAKLIVDQYSVSDPSTLDEALKRLMGHDKPADRPVNDKLALPKQFKDIRRKGLTRKFYQYLKSRGFTDDTSYFIDCYSLKCCLSGNWQDRIIFPIYQESKLVTWTSRALVNPVKAPRYMTLSEDDGALINIKDIVYNIDNLIEDPKDILLIGEGPFDALKMDYFGYEYGARATCLFSTSIGISQVHIISELCQIYKKVVVVFDQNTLEQKFHVLGLLDRYGVKSFDLPESIDDPGKMSPKQVKWLIKKVRSL